VAKECGFTICVYPDGTKTRGKTVCGTKHNVTIPNDCPPGSKRIAITHNHPGGNAPLGSDIDHRTAKKLGIIVCVKTDSTRCVRVK
jgi:hypothetical protein